MNRVIPALFLFLLLLGCSQGSSTMTAKSPPPEKPTPASSAETLAQNTATRSTPADARMKEPLTQQIAPPSGAQTREPPAPATAPPDLLMGEKVYNRSCVVCHGAGIAGAPRVGSRQAWKDRIAQGIDILTAHAINGYSGSSGFMPARGGDMSLTDEEIVSAVAFMVKMSR